MRREEWQERALYRGTSGDMVADILKDWKKAEEIWEECEKDYIDKLREISGCPKDEPLEHWLMVLRTSWEEPIERSW